jgi:hypothetical protein
MAVSIVIIKAITKLNLKQEAHLQGDYMSWQDVLKFNPFKALKERKAAKEKAEQEARDKASREMNEKRQARFASHAAGDFKYDWEKRLEQMPEGDISEERKNKIDDHFGINR